MKKIIFGLQKKYEAIKQKITFEKMWKKKNHEQRVIMLSTIIIGIAGSIILFSGFFIGQKTKTYLTTKFVLALIQFVVLQLFINKNNLKNNVMVSIPYIGFFNAIILYIKKP